MRRKRLKKEQLRMEDIAKLRERQEAAKRLLELKKKQAEDARRRAPTIKKFAIERAKAIPYLDKLRHEEARLEMQIRENKKLGMEAEVVLLEAELDGLREEIARRRK